jgi:hypothetical protein
MGALHREERRVLPERALMENQPPNIRPPGSADDTGRDLAMFLIFT